MSRIKSAEGQGHSETGSKPAASRPPGVLRSLFRPGLLVCFALAAVATVFGPRLARSLPDVSQREEYLFKTREIEINPPPHWVPQELVEQVIEQSKLPESVSLLDDRLTKTIAEAFGQHPWVESVERVAKSLPSRVSVELAYRRPVAMVQVKQGFYPIDAQGILLPPRDFSIADTQRYPMIVNVTTLPSGAAGTSWGDAGIIGSAQLAAVLTPHWKEFNLVTIENPVPKTGQSASDDGVYHLYTRGGSRIVWGRAPGSGHPGELTAEQKIGRMEEYVARFGGFDQPNGPYEIDIRHWQEITRVPLTAKGGIRSAPR